ncbi:MAG TPA: hypothetical protein VF999_08000 [Thermoanaerobaculia bacterium]
MKRDARRVARLALFGLIVAVGVLLVGPGVALGQGRRVAQNHFRCYIISSQTPQPAESITLEDQFNVGTPVSTLVGEPVMFCPPTEKTVGEQTFPIEEEEEHYALYPAPALASPRNVLVTDQFGTNVLWQITTPKYLMVPTAKTIGGVTFDNRENMNHYWCYEASGPRVDVKATLDDQFDGPDKVRITRPTLFCNPVEKVHNGVTFEILDEETHLACYEIHGKQKTQQFTFGVENQFETDEWQTAAWEILCAPAEKALPAP